MKKIFLSISTIATALAAYSQEIMPEQNILYGTNQMNGTARFQSLSGAMGALGADASAVSINPAGSGMFNYNHFSVSGEYMFNKTNNTYYNHNNSSKENSFYLPNLSAFFTVDKLRDEGVTKVNFGFTYQTMKRFDNYNFTSGNTNQSAVNYFLNHANNGYNGGMVPLDLVQTMPNETVGDLYDYLNGEAFGFSAQQAMLAYQGYLINDLTNGYASNMAPGNYYQENISYSSGHQSKLTGNLGLEINKKLYLGANLNIHFTDHLRNTSFYEENTDNISTGVKRYEFNNSTYTYGNGFSFQIGGIAKVTEQLRLGLAYESPTWNKLQDEFSQSLYSDYYDNNNQLQFANVNPNLITLFDTYKVITPGSFTGSLAYVFGKNGLISFDYQYKDYSKTKYSENVGSFAILNDYYKNELKAVNDIRVGAEYRINQISLRAGYRYANSPYKNEQIIGDLNSVSAGVGYSYGTSRLDLGYTFAHQPIKEYPLSSGIPQAANIKTKTNSINLTYTVNF